MNRENEGKTFESNIKKLEQIVQILDRGEAPLEEMLKYYEEGMALVRSSRDFLDRAEQKVIEISKKNQINDSNVEDLV